MGMALGDDDMYVEGLLETLNLRFGFFPEVKGSDLPKLDKAAVEARMNSIGISEIQFIQEEFELFKIGRPFWISAAALGLGGQWNASLKTKWLYVLSRLELLSSEDPNLHGGEAIVAALIKNFKKETPDPVHFQGHDARVEKRVLIKENDRPLFYIETDFLTISIPFAPQKRNASKKAPAKAAAAKSRATPRKR